MPNIQRILVHEMYNKYINANRMKKLKKTHEEKFSRLIALLCRLFVFLLFFFFSFIQKTENNSCSMTATKS